MKRYVRSDTVPANSYAKQIAKKTFGTWYDVQDRVKIYKQSTGYAVKYYAEIPAEADKVLEGMIETAEYFDIPVLKSFTKLGFLGSAHYYVACIVVPAVESADQINFC